ncbi:hypothetical protein C8A03DRAFT_16156 [Achaetomium macrosporum]|uniref:Uncharacterized protein n=1 Tax=Achaetomium macrosporum TaxID=79813 RepID=A0AAN7HA23_9PEZI|nr:hypothetical protein C8A03DRAFT_16156 [Achaetomium macrosporum]
MAESNSAGPDKVPRDFATTSNPSNTQSDAPVFITTQQPGQSSWSGSRGSSHVHYAASVNPARPGSATQATQAAPEAAFARSDTEAALSPTVRRRPTRAGTFKTVDDFQDLTIQPGWHPGAEPGVDPTKPDGGHASMPTLSAPCEITIVDFSHDNLSIKRLDNETLTPFLSQPQPAWVKCRWINVNGLSWDVIKALGRHKNLHRLAIEDLMDTENRTKAEWYPTHAFIILTLQKLVHLYDSDSEDSGSEDDQSHKSGLRRRSTGPRRWLRRLRKAFSGEPSRDREKEPGGGKTSSSGDLGGYLRSHPAGLSNVPKNLSQLRTLQRYQASPNDPRTQYMEKHSALASRDLAVACEQVSMFITNDNTIISFFEQSAEDIEVPIIRRLQTTDTIIRQSCDASMVGQAIIDAIIDLAIPVTACYGDVIGDLELDVLNRPNIGHTKKLYILISEINKILGSINPITSLINALRDHETDVAPDAVMAHLLDPTHGVIITPLTNTYLGDVLDHCVLITETLNQLKGSADGMIDLIFNTISAYQNESMKQLTLATIIFLPLTFLTGYFGQNFQPFNVLYEDIGYFWKIAIPVVVFTIILLLREAIYDYCKALLQRRYILRLKKSRSRNRRRKRS